MSEDTVCTSDRIIAQIVRTFAASTPCSEDLSDVVPAFWELVGPEGCYNDYLRGLLTKRETILFLMGCEAYSVDTIDKHYQLDRLRVDDKVYDLRSQSQSTGNSTRFHKGHGETRYDETSEGRSDGSSDRHMRSSEVGDGVSFYADDGRGSAFNSSGSTNEIEALEQRLQQNTIEGASQENGNRRDCNYEYSTNHSNGQSFVLPIVPLSIGAGVTGSASEWRKFTATRARDEDTSFRERHHAVYHDLRDERIGRGSHNWSNIFFSHVDWFDRDYEVRRQHERADHRRDVEAHSRGDGDGFSEDKTTAHNAAQGTAEVVVRMDRTRNDNRTWTRNEDYLANSQRFRNLRDLYDQLTEQIQHVKKRIKARAQPYIGQLPCNCDGCCTCVPRAIGCGLSFDQHSFTSMGRECL